MEHNMEDYHPQPDSNVYEHYNTQENQYVDDSAAIKEVEEYNNKEPQLNEHNPSQSKMIWSSRSVVRIILF